LLTKESAKAPITALQIPARRRKPWTNEAANAKVIAAIIKVEIPENKLNVTKLGTKKNNPKIGLTIAATIPITPAEMYALAGLSISTPTGNLVIISKLEALTIQAINRSIKSIFISLPSHL